MDDAALLAFPAEFPPADATLEALLRLILTRKPVAKFKLGERRMRLFLVPAEKAAVPIQHAVPCRIGDGDTWLNLDERRLAMLMPDLATGLHLLDLPEALAEGVLTASLQSVLPQIAKLIPITPAFEGLADRAVTGRAPLGLALGESPAQAHNATPIGVLHPGASDLAAAIALLENLAPIAGWAGAALTPVALGFELASIRLRAATLRTLARGDVLLLPAMTDLSRLTLTAGARRHVVALGRRDGRALTIEALAGGTMTEKNTGGAPPEDPGAIDASIDVDALEVTLTFSIGERTLTLAELQALAPGYVFELGRRDEGEVRILSSGAEIARGEIVQIEERLGVRILSLAAR